MTSSTRSGGSEVAEDPPEVDDEALATWRRLMDVTRALTDDMAALVCGGCGGRLSLLRADDGWGQPPAVVRVCITDRKPTTPFTEGPDANIWDFMGRGERPGQTAPPARSFNHRGSHRIELTCRCGRHHLIRTDKVVAAFLRVREAGGRNVVVGEGRHQRRTGSFHI